MNVIILLLIAAMSVTTPGLSDVRAMYSKAPSDESKCRELIILLGKLEEAKYPLLAGYKGSATMIMAKHVYNPVSKLSYFNKGKKILERAIAVDSSIVELRYLRFTIQQHAPSFLYYKSRMATDRQFLVKSLPTVKDIDLFTAISKAINH